MHMEGINYQNHSNHQKERHRKHFDGGIFIHKIRYLFSKNQHDDHGNDNSQNHYYEIINKSNGCEYGVEGKNYINNNNLSAQSQATRARYKLVGVYLPFTSSIQLSSATEQLPSHN